MAQLPSAVIFINPEIDDGIKNTLISQLNIDETITSTEFDARLAVDPNYPTIVKLNNYRLLVILQDFRNYPNKSIADLLLYLRLGIAYIENYGCPRLAFDIQRINIYELLRFVKSPQVTILPNNYYCHDCCKQQCNKHLMPFGSDKNTYGIGGIIADELKDQSGIYSPNPDNENCNIPFINRK